MVRLAQELIDAIVDEVAATQNWFDRPDHESLKACALVARTFRVPSQRKLFHFHVVCYRGLGLDLVPAPHICGYVHDLDIRGVSHKTLAKILPLFTRVRRLVICGRDWKPELTSAEIGPLVSILNLPSLRCLGMISCNHVPLSFVSQIMSRHAEVAVIDTSIHLSDARFPSTPAGHSTVPLSRLALSPITFPASAAAITNLAADSARSFDWQHLQHLTLVVRGEGIEETLGQIATKCVDTLQHLEIRFEGYHDDGLDLPRIPGLRFLTIQGSVGKLRVPESWRRFMATLPECAPNVEAVTITIDAGYQSFLFDIEEPQTDRALTNLPRLRELRFDINTKHGEELRFMRFSEATKKMLPMARDAGLLSFAVHRKMPVDFLNENMRYFSN
ncbi:hypothetical protein C8R47DRAFT_1324742 [Mycena vitilis]|nr:hypothetical protein C8R47DRAFT_1324742 [Mycena vitilis]